MLDHHLEPSIDYWNSFEKPEKIATFIEEICVDLLKKGDRTKFASVYDAIYELVEEEVHQTKIEEDARHARFQGL